MILPSYFQALFFLLAVLLLPGCQGPPEPDQPIVWRFAIEESVGSVQHDYATAFAERIASASDGQIKVLIYPYGTLGTSTQITEQLNLGILQFAMASPGSLGKFIPELQAFLLHFVLPTNEADINRMLANQSLMQRLDQWYQPKGLKLLSMYSEGQMAWTLNKEVRQPQDFQGIKMRVMTTPLLLAAYGAYGASPTPMPYSEVYSGLQLKMIDGQVNPLFAIERQKFHEVTSWLILPGHTSFVTSCAANRRFYDELPDDQRIMVDQTIAELQDYIFQKQSQLQWTSLRQIIEDKKRRQSMLHIAGDLQPFLQELSAAERTELIEENPFLELHPPLSDQEIAAFRDASEQAVEVFQEIGGSESSELLELIRKN